MVLVNLPARSKAYEKTLKDGTFKKEVGDGRNFPPSVIANRRGEMRIKFYFSQIHDTSNM